MAIVSMCENEDNILSVLRENEEKSPGYDGVQHPKSSQFFRRATSENQNICFVVCPYCIFVYQFYVSFDTLEIASEDK
jgi:hypothetical protein